MSESIREYKKIQYRYTRIVKVVKERSKRSSQAGRMKNIQKGWKLNDRNKIARWDKINHYFGNRWNGNGEEKPSTIHT